MDSITSPEAWIALLTLTVLEIVLGIDNIIFVAILADRAKAELRAQARQVGLVIAMLTRLALLFSIVWIMRLTEPLFSVFAHEVSGRDLILIAGGIFLLFKSTRELHHKLEGDDGEARGARPAMAFMAVIVQIAILDIVFSLDSVITAVGVADDVWVMVTAIVISAVFMIAAAGPVSRFVNRHPTVKVLALSFLLLIGMTLVADGMGQHIPKGYVYFAMGFSIFVEILNLQVTAKKAPVHLRGGASLEPEAATNGG